MELTRPDREDYMLANYPKMNPRADLTFMNHKGSTCPDERRESHALLLYNMVRAFRSVDLIRLEITTECPKIGGRTSCRLRTSSPVQPASINSWLVRTSGNRIVGPWIFFNQNKADQNINAFVVWTWIQCQHKGRLYICYVIT